MKKIYLFLLVVFIVSPLNAQSFVKSGMKVTLDMLLKRNVMNVAKKGASVSTVAKEVITKGVTAEIPAGVSVDVMSKIPDVSASLLTNEALSSLQTPLNNSLLAVSTDLAQQMIRCGQSYVGFPQYDYVRHFYEKLDAIPSELNSTLSSYGAFMLERKYPGIPDAEGIAENALEEVSEYIPSYNALIRAVEDESQLKAITASLEHQVELAYPSLEFEGTFVRTFRDLESVYADGTINRLGGRNVHQAMEQAHDLAVKKDTGFYLIKVGNPGQNKLHDVLVLDLPKLQWSSYKKTLEKLPEMIEE